MQRLREAERELVFEEYAGRAEDIVTATIQRIEPRQIVVDLGRTEAIIPEREQVPTERYRPNQKLKVYIAEVGRTVWNRSESPRRSLSSSTGSGRAGPGKRVSSSPRTKVCFLPVWPPDRMWDTWIRPGLGPPDMFLKRSDLFDRLGMDLRSLVLYSFSYHQTDMSRSRASVIG